MKLLPLLLVLVATATEGEAMRPGMRSVHGNLPDAGPPTLPSGFKSLYLAREGATVKLRCPVIGEGLMYEWFLRGEKISLGWLQARLNDKTGVLRMKDLVESNTGVYKCRAVNGFGHVTVNVTLVVCDVNCTNRDEVEQRYLQPHDTTNTGEGGGGVPPSFTDPMEDVLMHTAGSNIRLHCPTRGNPRPTIQWFKGSTLLPPPHATIGGRHSHGHSLHINALDLGDSGEYTCQVSNPLGSVSHTFRLEVAAFPPGSARFIQPFPRNMSVQEGHVARFSCHVSADTQPQIQWVKVVNGADGEEMGKQILEVEGGHRYYVLDQTNGVRRISEKEFVNELYVKADRLAAGSYVCVTIHNSVFIQQEVFLRVLPEDPSTVGRQGGDGTEKPKPGGKEEASFNMLPVVISVVVGVVVLLLIIVVCICQKRRR